MCLRDTKEEKTHMKKLILGIICLALFVLVLGGCAKTGQATAKPPTSCNYNLTMNAGDTSVIVNNIVYVQSISSGGLAYFLVNGEQTRGLLPGDSYTFKDYSTLYVNSINVASEKVNFCYNPLIRANSCDADSQCETKSLVADGISRIGVVVIDGKTISTKGGSTSALTLTSDNKLIMVDGTLRSDYITTKTIKGDGDLTLTTGNNGALLLNPEKKSVVVNGTLSADYFSVTNLKGDGNAYACLDNNGKLFRSTKPCI